MEALRSAFRSSLRRSLRTLSPEDRLAAAWPIVCGSSLAARGAIVSYDAGVLTVRVTHSAWLDPFETMHLRLAGDLSRVSGVPVRQLRFTERELPVPAAPHVAGD